jgi:hypothetical protein
MHGLQICTETDDPDLSTAIEHLLRPYALADTVNGSSPDTLYCRVQAVDRLPALVPIDASSLAQEDGVSYSAADGRLFLETEGFAISVADLEAHRLDVYVNRARASSTWSVEHFAILPLIVEFLRLRSLFPIHAAALEHHGRALILPAVPGSGKTTLAVALVRAGLRLLSDDMPFLCRDGGEVAVLASLEDVNVCADSIGFFDELRFLAAQVPDERGKRSFSPGALFPGGLAERGAPRLLVFPALSGAARSVLHPISPMEGFRSLLEHSLRPINPALGVAHFETMLDTAAACDCYRLETGRDPDEAAGLLIDRLLSLHD